MGAEVRAPGGDSCRHYLALGDSISIDLYPGLDVAEREGLLYPPDGLGSASLFHRNDDARWPGFRGRDLSTRFGGPGRTDLCADGATTRSVLEDQLPRLPEELAEPAVVTLTVGGNDLLELVFGWRRWLEVLPWASGVRDVEEIGDAVERIVGRLRTLLPHSTLIVGTVYDPTDGTGRLEGIERPEALEKLHALNHRIRRAAKTADARLADIHDHFLGHGLREPDPEARWYWRHSLIEPSARGAHEVRRLWWEALEA